jgi:tetratricopeptide (TPR) repeat protein
MAISVSCPCSKQLRLKDIYAGKRIKCPACGKGLSVPALPKKAAANGQKEAPAEPSPFDFLSQGTAELTMEASAFDFFSPATEAAPAPPEEKKAAPAPKQKTPEPAPDLQFAVQPADAKPASVTPVAVEAETQPETKGAEIDPPFGEEVKPAGRRAIWPVAAIVAGFLLLSGAAIYGLFKLGEGGGEGTGGSDGGAHGGFVDHSNDVIKLSPEERKRLGLPEGDTPLTATQVAEARQKKADEEKRQEVQRKKDAEEKQRQDKEAKEAAEREKARKAAEDKKLEAIRKFLADAETAMAAKQFARAIQDYKEVQKLAPDNADAKIGLVKVQEEQKRLEDQQRQAQFAKLVATGKESLTKKSYHKAVENLEAALKIKDDAAAREALQKAQDGKAKQDKEVEKVMKRVWQALKRKDLVTAGKMIDGAIKLYPDHPDLLKAKTDVAAEKSRHKMAEDAKNKGRLAMKAKRYREAFQAFSLAMQLAPNDAVAKSLLQQAKEEVLRENRKIAGPLIEKGRAAYKKKKYEEAVSAWTEASKLVPLDRETRTLFTKAQQEVAKIQQAAAAERMKQDAIKRAALIQKLLADVRAALKANKVDVAAKALAQVTPLAPNNPEVISLNKELKKIQDALAAKAKEGAAQKQRLADYQAKMKAGKTALDAKKFDDAIKAYREAVALAKPDQALIKEAEKALKDAEKAKADFANLKIKPK